MLKVLLEGPSAYRGQTGWSAWAVLPAAVVIFVLAAMLGLIAAWIYGGISGLETNVNAPGGGQEHLTASVTAWIAGMQVGVIGLTLIAAGFFSSDRPMVLSLLKPAGGWSMLGWALLPMFVVAGIWTGSLLLWDPEIVAQDLRPFVALMHSDAVWLVLLVICVGAPLSEELLFRGFLFSGLAKSRLGLIGTSLVTTLLWTSLHAGYSIFGLIEVLWIGLYFSWLLVRTGSLWVTIFCHATYNTVVAVTLMLVTLPAAPVAP